MSVLVRMSMVMVVGPGQILVVLPVAAGRHCRKFKTIGDCTVTVVTTWMEVLDDGTMPMRNRILGTDQVVFVIICKHSTSYHPKNHNDHRRVIMNPTAMGMIPTEVTL